MTRQKDDLERTIEKILKEDHSWVMFSNMEERRNVNQPEGISNSEWREAFKEGIPVALENYELAELVNFSSHMVKKTGLRPLRTFDCDNIFLQKIYNCEVQFLEDGKEERAYSRSI